MSYANEDFEEMVAQMVTIGLKMDKRTHALLTVFYMLEQDVDVSPHINNIDTNLQAPDRLGVMHLLRPNFFGHPYLDS